MAKDTQTKTKQDANDVTRHCSLEEFKMIVDEIGIDALRLVLKLVRQGYKAEEAVPLVFPVALKHSKRRETAR